MKADNTLPATVPQDSYVVDCQEVDDDLRPLNVVVVGNAGSGKSSVGRSAYVEPLLETQNRRVCIIDPTGVWWGLRFWPDGTPAFRIAILGGPYSDVPISAYDGDAVGRLVAESDLQTIIDLSEFSQRQKIRFMTAFFQAVYQKNKRPLHLVLDEADEFAPQNPMPDSRKMFHHIDRIVRRGRVRGFRVMLITQRPAVLHKNVLSQANVLIAMRLLGSQDRAAVQLWIRGQGDVEAGAEVLNTLAKLQTGEGWLWAPTMNVLRRGRFSMFRTFDSSRTPKDDEPIVQPPGPFPALREKRLLDWRSIVDHEEEEGPEMPPAAPVAKAEPKAKGKRASTGQAAAAKAPAAIDIEPIKAHAFENGRRQGFEDGYAAATSTITAQVQGVVKAGQRFLDELRSVTVIAADRDPSNLPELVKPQPAEVRARVDKRVREAIERLDGKPRTATVTDASVGAMVKYGNGLLYAIGSTEYAADEPTWSEACALAGFNPTSGPVRIAIKHLTASTLVAVGDHGGVMLTALGRERWRDIAEAKPKQLGVDQVVEAWCQKLTRPAPEILRFIASGDKGSWKTIADIGAIDGMASTTSGPFRVALKALRSNGLTEEEGSGSTHRVRLSRALRVLKRR